MKSAIILCGGKATRMGELCVATPKILMKVGSDTVLDHQLSMLRKADVSRVVLAVGHLKDTLKSEIGSSRRGIDIVYSDEDQPLGTAGAFKNAFQYLDADEPCFGLNGDIYMPEFSPNIMEKLNIHGAQMIIATMMYTPPYGIISSKDGVNFGYIDGYQEKRPVMCNAGFYLMHPSCRDLFPDVGSIERDVFETGIPCGYYKHEGIWFDIGTPHDLKRANDYNERMAQEATQNQ